MTIERGTDLQAIRRSPVQAQQALDDGSRFRRPHGCRPRAAWKSTTVDQTKSKAV